MRWAETRRRIVQGCLWTGCVLLTLGSVAMAVHACLNSPWYAKPIEAALTAFAGVAIACIISGVCAYACMSYLAEMSPPK